MGTSYLAPGTPMTPGRLVLAVDTCGPTGSVALGRLAGRDLEILGQTELEGRSYSATLVAAVSRLAGGGRRGAEGSGRDCGGERAGQLYRGAGGAERGEGAGGGGADSGGGDFAAAGFVRGSRACRRARWMRTGARCFCGVEEIGQAGQGVAGRERRSWRAIKPAPLRVAVCDEAAAALLAAAWPEAQLVRCAAPVAADALRLGEARLVAGGNVDLALLDGNYLRRSDAEIFGEAAAAGRARA